MPRPLWPVHKKQLWGPGKSEFRRTAALRKALCDAVTAEDMYKIGKVMLEKALAGDLQAAKFLASYVIGRPMPAADPDRLDLEELRQYQKEKAATATLNSDMDSIAPGFACYLISQVRPCRTLSLATTLGQALDTGVVPGEDVGQRSDPDNSRQDQSRHPRQADANGAIGGQQETPPPAPAASPERTPPSPIGDNGPGAPATPSRPAQGGSARPPISDWPGAADRLDPKPPPSSNRDNGSSGPRRRR